MPIIIINREWWVVKNDKQYNTLIEWYSLLYLYSNVICDKNHLKAWFI